MLELLYATGLRVSELVALPRAAASTKERYLVVKGKGGRELWVRAGNSTQRLEVDDAVDSTEPMPSAVATDPTTGSASRSARP